MKIFGLIGIFLVYLIIIAVDWNGMKTAENSNKVKTIYLSIVVVGILVGVLEMYSLIPRFDVIIVDYYKKLFGPQ
jgi:hypothetical protein